MPSRTLVAVITTAVLVAAVFVLRTTAPAESLQAVAAVPIPAAERAASVSVVTEVVTAPTVGSPRLTALGSRSIARSKPATPLKRSLFARLFLGNGGPRPEPFPRPGRAVSARP